MRWSQKAENLLDLPDGALTGEAHVDIDGRRRLAVEGACDILAYEDTVVRLMTVSGEVRINGDGLSMESYHAGGVVLTGRLLSVEFL